MILNRLALGTANFGRSSDYWRRRVSNREAERIIKYASRLWGIDTAKAYEDAEKIIGASADHQLQITTKGKTPELEKSLEDLNRTHVYAYYAHRMDRIWESWYGFTEAKRRRLTRKIGFSIYEPDEIAPALTDIVQLPYNLAEYRHNSFVINYLKRCGVEVHIRSIFGRGTLIPQYGIKKCLWAAFETKADKIIFGVDKLDHLKQVLEVAEKMNAAQIHDENILDPRRWQDAATSILEMKM